jgi:hypothetical protein
MTRANQRVFCLSEVLVLGRGVQYNLDEPQFSDKQQESLCAA